jgi:hypothetical protein
MSAFLASLTFFASLGTLAKPPTTGIALSAAKP